MDNITDTAIKNHQHLGSRTVYQQDIHIQNVTIQYLEIYARDIFKNYKGFDKNYFVKVSNNLLMSLKIYQSGVGM